MRQALDLTGRKPRAKGSFSAYYRLPRGKGVKVICDITKGAPSIERLMTSTDWRMALREAKDIKKAQKSKHSPRCYGVKPVKRGRKWFPGIFVEHINGIRLGSLKRSHLNKQQQKKWFPKSKIAEHLFSVLEDFGVFCQDFHDQNIIVVVRKKKVKSIKWVDFSPDTIDWSIGRY